MRLSLLGVAACAVVALTSCEDRPGARSELDMQVGRASSASLSVSVKDGLATIRAIDDQQLWLWGSAPLFDLTLRWDGAEPHTLQIVVDNALPDASFSASSNSSVTAAAAAPDDPPTRLRFAVELPASETVELQLVTADSQDTGPYRIALMSDIQEGVDIVSDAFMKINAQPETRFVLGAGDMAISGSRDELLAVQEQMRLLAIPYFTTLGNHDVHSGSPWHEIFGRGNFSFVFRGVQYTLIDSAAATVDDVAYQWLEQWLEEGRQRVHIVGMHIPPLDPVGARNGAFGSRNEAGQLLASLAAANVDLTVYGHIHSFYQFNNASIPAIISGGGGAKDEKLDGYGRHFVTIELGAQSGVISTTLVRIDP